MIKRLLNKIVTAFSYEYDRGQIEAYLANSVDTYDLESRQKELDRKGIYNRIYI